MTCHLVDIVFVKIDNQIFLFRNKFILFFISTLEVFLKRFMDKLNKIPKAKAGNALWDRRIKLDTFCLLVESYSIELLY